MTFIPVEMENRTYPDLTGGLRSQWKGVRKSCDHSPGISYRPCQVTLDDGAVVDAVYVTNAQEYIDVWGIWPDQDRGKREIDLSRVVEISESLNRLPPRIANKIYKAGESGMGYCVFTLLFKDGTQQEVGSGGAVDFVKLPTGKQMTDIVDVLPHEGGRDEPIFSASLDYYWCLFGEGKQTMNPHRSGFMLALWKRACVFFRDFGFSSPVAIPRRRRRRAPPPQK